MATRGVSSSSSSSSSSSYSVVVEAQGSGGAGERFLQVLVLETLLMALAVVTLTANGAMLAVFVRRRSVRRCKNIYVASLAAADLGIGLTIPIAALQQVESRWALTGTWCAVYQAARCWLLSASLLSILLISMDRWWSVFSPMTYRARRSTTLALGLVLAVWGLSLALHAPSVLLWHALGLGLHAPSDPLALPADVSKDDADGSDVIRDGDRRSGGDRTTPGLSPSSPREDELTGREGPAFTYSSLSVAAGPLSALSESYVADLFSTLLPSALSQASALSPSSPLVSLSSAVTSRSSPAWGSALNGSSSYTVMTALPWVVSTMPSVLAVSQTGRSHHDLDQTAAPANGSSDVQRPLQEPDVTSAGSEGRCELPFSHNFHFVVTWSAVVYLLPLLALWILNLSLFFKITRRRTLKIRRSLSNTDSFLLTFRKSSDESDSSHANSYNNNGGGYTIVSTGDSGNDGGFLAPPCPRVPSSANQSKIGAHANSCISGIGGSSSSSSNNNNIATSGSVNFFLEATELRSSEHHQQRFYYPTSRAGRRHTFAVVPGLVNPPATFHHYSSHRPLAGVGGRYLPAQNSSRRPKYTQCRRMSLQDAFTDMGRMAAMAGAVPNCNLPRVASASSGLHGSTMIPMGVWFGTSQRRNSVCSARKQSEDLVKELLVRQDRKAARLLALLVTVFTACWLPATALAVLRARHPAALHPWLLDLAQWVLVSNSAINPFLYGLLSADFRAILRQWLYFRPSLDVHSRLKQSLLYWSFPSSNVV